MKRKRVCAVSDMDDGDMKRVEARPAIAVYRVDGEFFATAATCTHMESCLTEGYLDDDVVECVLHGAKFNVKDGRALTMLAPEPLQKFDVLVEGGEVYVDIPDDRS